MPRSVWFEVVDIQGNKILDSHVDGLSDKSSIGDFRDALRARFSDDLPANLSPMEIAFFENRVAYDAKVPLACISLLGDLGQNDANALIVQMPGVGNACWDFWMAIVRLLALIVMLIVGILLLQLRSSIGLRVVHFLALGYLLVTSGRHLRILVNYWFKKQQRSRKQEQKKGSKAIQNDKQRHENMKKIESRKSLESLESISIAESDGSIGSINEFYELV